ncbi:MAG: hypothetical protein AB2A00_02445 [Myxococcota bacterium]
MSHGRKSLRVAGCVLGILTLCATTVRAQDAVPPPATSEAAPPTPAAPTTAEAAPATPEQHGATRPLRIAVNDLTPDGVSPRVARIVTESLVSEIRKLRHVVVIGMSELKAILDLEAQKQLAGCSQDACLADIAGLLGVDGLVVGRLGRLSNGHTFTVRRIDEREGTVVAAVDLRLKAGNGEEFLSSVGPAVEKLFPELPLKPGLRRGVAEEVALRLNPPPLPRGAFLIPTAITGISALVGVTAGLVAAVALADYHLYAYQGRTRPIDGASLVAKGRAALGFSVVANLGYAVALVALISCGITALFVDWHGYRDEGAAS